MSDIFKSTYWDNLLEANPKATHLPNLIRSFHTTQSQQEFDDLFKEFTEFIHPMGLITATTIPATRILIHLLQNTEDIHKKWSYMRRLYYILGSTLMYPSRHNSLPNHFRFAKPDYPTQFRELLTVYDMISENYQVFVDQLKYNDRNIAIATIVLISRLPDKLESFIPQLLTCVEKSDDQWLQAIGAWIFAEYNANRSIKSTWDGYGDILLDWVKNGDSFPFRASAAFGRMEVHHFTPSSLLLPEIVITTLAEFLGKTELHDIRELHDIKRDKSSIAHAISYNLPFSRIAQTHILYRHGYTKFITLLAILDQATLTPETAHFHYRELLNIAFRRTNRNESHLYWETHQHIESSNPPDKLIYEYGTNFTRGQYRPDKPLNDRQKQVLQAIVDCESFWEIPTNLFSYFYGLPDNRDELYDLANQG